MASVFDYVFNIGGNFSAQINGMSAAAAEFSVEVKKSQKWTETYSALPHGRGSPDQSNHPAFNRSSKIILQCHQMNNTLKPCCCRKFSLQP